jgi:phosphinothricin acetyltransferase
MIEIILQRRRLRLVEITLRNAGVEDLPMIVDIYNSTVQSRMVTADTEPVSLDDRLGWFNDHNPYNRPLWIVEYKGEICGWVSLQSFYGRPAYSATAEISIYLHEDFRGKGLGKKILSKVIEQCPLLEIDILLGFIFKHNEPSIRLFSSFGFEKWAHLPEVAILDGIKRDLIILGKNLS